MAHDSQGDDQRGGHDHHGDHDHRGLGAVGDHVGQLVTFDQFDTTTYLHSAVAADGSFVEHFIFQVNGFELNGSPVSLPGFGSDYGMYFLVDATGSGEGSSAVFDTMHIALMVDRGNNDGSPSATEQGVGFSNGTHGDLTLATGTLLNAGITVGSDGVFHPDFTQQVTLTAAGKDLFGPSFDPSTILQELLTTPGGPVTFDEGGGNVVNVVNGAGATGLPANGTVALDPQAPLSIRPALLDHGSNDYGEPSFAAHTRNLLPSGP